MLCKRCGHEILDGFDEVQPTSVANHRSPCPTIEDRNREIERLLADIRRRKADNRGFRVETDALAMRLATLEDRLRGLGKELSRTLLELEGEKRMREACEDIIRSAATGKSLGSS